MKTSVPIHGLIHLLQQRAKFSAKTLLQMHAQLIATGLHTHHSCLLSLFNLCLSNPSTLSHAAAIFGHTQEPNSPEWLNIIRLTVLEADPFHAISLFRAMLSLRTHISLDEPFIFASLVKACNRLSAFREGKSIHCQVFRLGLDYNVNVLNSLIYLYSSLGNSVSNASVVFENVPEKTVVTINCMISGFLKNKFFVEGLLLFNRVRGCCYGINLKPDYVSLVIVISGCAEYGDFRVGYSLHTYCLKVGLVLRNEVSNVLINLYAKFGYVDDAVRLFNEMPEKDLVSWNTLIAGYAKNNACKKAFSLFREMRIDSIVCDRVTLISLVLASANGEDFNMGKAVHGYMKVCGIETTVPVGTALINLYAKSGLIEFARNVFDELPAENIASWNSMISGFVECGLYDEALKLFNIMQSRGLKSDEVTLLGLILACRNSGQLHHGIHIHHYYAENSELCGSTILSNALIDMYAKCGSMTRAKAVFDKMVKRDVISWTSIIVGHAINGEGEEALVAFRQMGVEKIVPNSVTFIGVLMACDHAGLVDNGCNLYEIMCNVYHIKPGIEHCGCMVDMHARAGMLEEAYEFVKNMPVEPNAVVWRMLINACKVHGYFDLGISLMGGFIELKKLPEPEDHVISSSMLAEAGRWDDVLHARSFMVAHKTPKLAGKSSISEILPSARKETISTT